METRFTLKTSFNCYWSWYIWDSLHRKYPRIQKCFNGRRVRRQRKSWDEQLKHDDEANISVMQLFLSFSVLSSALALFRYIFWNATSITPPLDPPKTEMHLYNGFYMGKTTYLYPKLSPFRLCTHKLNSSKNRYFKGLSINR